jgi:hypothetical protein
VINFGARIFIPQWKGERFRVFPARMPYVAAPTNPRKLNENRYLVLSEMIFSLTDKTDNY